VRVLLTGATGLIGSAVAARLAADGHEILGVARALDAAARRVAVARWISDMPRGPSIGCLIFPESTP